MDRRVLHTGVFGDGRAERQNRLEHLVVVDGRILLKWALKRLEGGAQIGLIALRVENTGARLLWIL